MESVYRAPWLLNYQGLCCWFSYSSVFILYATPLSISCFLPTSSPATVYKVQFIQQKMLNKLQNIHSKLPLCNEKLI